MISLKRSAMVLAGIGVLGNGALAQAANTSTDVEVLEEVVVTVFGRGQLAATVRDVPQAVSVFDSTILKDVGAVEVRDVARFIPGAALTQARGSVLPGLVSARGFATTYTIDGQIMPSMVSPDTAGLERVEVLMGPASVLYGTMEPGAVINMVMKRPQDQAHFGVGLEFGSYDFQRVTADVGGPLSDGIRARANLAYETRETYYDHWERERIFFAPVIEFDLSEKTRLTLEGWYQRFTDENGSDARLLPVEAILFPNPNGPLRDSFTIAQPGLGDFYRDALNLRVGLTHELSDNWRVSLTGIHDMSRREGIIWTTEVGGITPDRRTVVRTVLRQDQEQPTTIGNLGLQGSFDTGPIAHQVFFGADYSKQVFRGPQGLFNIGTMDIYAPVYPTNVVIPANNRLSRIETTTTGVFAQDRARWGDLSVLVGLRWSEIETLSASAVLPAALPPLVGIKQDKVSQQYGLMYDVTDWATVYASRVTSFVPRNGSTFGGTAFAPENAIQHEVGVKLDLGKSGLTGNVAVFEIEKPNLLIPDVNNPGFLIPAGEARSRGVELSVFGKPTPAWTVHSSYAFLDTESQTGFDLANAPPNTATFFSRYDFLSGALQGLGVSGTVQYRDEVHPAAIGGLTLPDYTRFDFGFAYSVNDSVEVSLNVLNAFSAQIYNGISTRYVSLDEGRTFTAGFRFDF